MERKSKQVTSGKFVSFDAKVICDFTWQTFAFKGTYTHKPTGEKSTGYLELNVILN